MNVKFFGYFDGTIDLFHLNNLDPEKDFKVGQKIKARVLWDSIGSTPKKFSLSLATHVLSLGVARVESAEEGVLGEELVEGFPVGKMLEEVRVVRMDDEWGLTCEILAGDHKVPAFVHVCKSLSCILLLLTRRVDLANHGRSSGDDSEIWTLESGNDPPRTSNRLLSSRRTRPALIPGDYSRTILLTSQRRQSWRSHQSLLSLVLSSEMKADDDDRGLSND